MHGADRALHSHECAHVMPRPYGWCGQLRDVSPRGHHFRPIDLVETEIAGATFEGAPAPGSAKTRRCNAVRHVVAQIPRVEANLPAGFDIVLDEQHGRT